MRRVHTSYQHRLVVAGCAGVVAMLLAGCSSGKSKVTNTPPAIASNLSALTTSSAGPTSAAPVTTTSAAAAVNLSGSWSGKYSGAFVGTFKLSWQQSGSSLNGTITLSTPPQTLSLSGTVSGSQISFGTVGSQAITYSGTVSGSSMSGSYQVGGNPGGAWSANKS